MLEDGPDGLSECCSILSRSLVAWREKGSSPNGLSLMSQKRSSIFMNRPACWTRSGGSYLFGQAVAVTPVVAKRASANRRCVDARVFVGPARRGVGGENCQVDVFGRGVPGS